MSFPVATQEPKIRLNLLYSLEIVAEKQVEKGELSLKLNFKFFKLVAGFRVTAVKYYVKSAYVSVSGLCSFLGWLTSHWQRLAGHLNRTLNVFSYAVALNTIKSQKVCCEKARSFLIRRLYNRVLCWITFSPPQSWLSSYNFYLNLSYTHSMLHYESSTKVVPPPPDLDLFRHVCVFFP